MASTARIEELRKKYEENQRRYFAPLANEYRKAGQLEEAIALCRAWLPQQPGHMSGHIVFGQTLFEAGELSEARTVFETALDLDPENLIALRHLGDIARQHGEVESARSWYRRVLDADPRNDEIAALLSKLDSLPSQPESLTSQSGSSPSATSELPPVRGPETDVHAVEIAVDVAGASLSAEAVAWSGTPEVEDSTPAGTPTASSARDTGTVEEATDAAAALFDDAPSAGSEEPTQVGFAMDVGLSSDGIEASASAGMSSGADAETVSGRFDESSGADRETSSGVLPESSGGTAERPDYPPRAIVQNDMATGPSGVADTSASEMGLEVMEFVPPPRNTTQGPVADANPLEGHFLADDAGASSTPAAFVTETMAELYLQQGFRDEALGVYRQLLQQSPGDDALRDRVAQLERGSSSSVGMAAISDDVIESARRRQTAHTPTSMRTFLSRLAGRRAPRREAAPDEPETPASAEQQDEAADPGSALDFGDPAATASGELGNETGGANAGAESEESGNFPSFAEFSAPNEADQASPTPEAEERGSLPSSAEFFTPAEQGGDEQFDSVETNAPQAGSVDPAPATEAAGGPAEDGAEETGGADDDRPTERRPQAGGSVGGLFENAVIQAGDEAAASALASAFAPPGEAPDSKLLGRPTRAAKNEISLDHVFRESGSRPATPRERTSFSFDQFFSEGASAPARGSSDEVHPTADDTPPDDIEQFNSWLEGLKKK